MEQIALQTITVSLILGVTSYTLARWLKIPAILFYLLSGMIFGAMGLEVIDANSLAGGLLILVEFAVVIILFEGALSLSSQSFRTQSSAIRRVLALSIPVTGLGATCLMHYFLDVSWRLSAVFGTLIVVTGPTVIGPLLKNVQLSQRLQVLLHWEAIWGDVIGVLLSALALELALPASVDSLGLGHVGLTFALRIIVGIAVGVFSGYVLARLFLPWASHLRDVSLPGLIAVAGALGTFHLANMLVESSGPLAAASCGFWVSHLKSKTLHEIRHFKEQLSSLFISTMFVLLSASINPVPVLQVLPAMLLVALTLGAVVRPLSILLALFKTSIPWAERIFVGFIGPRGIIAMATASYAALVVPGERQELDILLNTTFSIIFLSGAVATVLCRPLASLLRVNIPESGLGILLVGVNTLSSALARFADRYVPVAFVDTNRSTCSMAETLGHATVCADVLDSEVYEEAKEGGFGRLLAITTDGALNELIAHKAAVHLGLDRVSRVLARGAEESINLEPSSPVRIAFAEDFLLREAVRKLEQGEAVLEVLAPDEARDDRVVPLLQVTDDGRGVQIFHPGQELGGEALCLVDAVSTGLSDVKSGERERFHDREPNL